MKQQKQQRSKKGHPGKLIGIRVQPDILKKLEKRGVYIQKVVRDFLTTLAGE